LGDRLVIFKLIFTDAQMLTSHSNIIQVSIYWLVKSVDCDWRSWRMAMVKVTGFVCYSPPYDHHWLLRQVAETTDERTDDRQEEDRRTRRTLTSQTQPGTRQDLREEGPRLEERESANNRPSCTHPDIHADCTSLIWENVMWKAKSCRHDTMQYRMFSVRYRPTSWQVANLTKRRTVGYRLLLWTKFSCERLNVKSGFSS